MGTLSGGGTTPSVQTAGLLGKSNKPDLAPANHLHTQTEAPQGPGHAGPQLCSSRPPHLQTQLTVGTRISASSKRHLLRDAVINSSSKTQGLSPRGAHGTRFITTPAWSPPALGLG